MDETPQENEGHERRSTMSQLRSSIRKFAGNHHRPKPRYKLSEKQKEDLKEAFDTFDVKCSGFITEDELRVAIRALGYNPSMAEIDDVLDMVMPDGSRHVAFNEFVYIMNLKMAGKDSDDDMLKALYLMSSTQKNARINFDKLKSVAQELGENLNDEELREMIQMADLNHDGFVDAEEFLAITRKAPDRI